MTPVTPAAAVRPVLPTELPESVTGQLHEARLRLHADGVAAHVSLTDVDDALAAAVERFRDTHVHAFLGVLVEREVREALGLRRTG